ncbi:hypothetical protein D3C87_1746330 [compost metagenome]
MLGQRQNRLQVRPEGVRQRRAAAGKTLQTLVQSGEGLGQAVVQVVRHAFTLVFLRAKQPVDQVRQGAIPGHERHQQSVVFKVRGQQGGEQLQGFAVFVVRRPQAHAVGQHQGAKGISVATA